MLYYGAVAFCTGIFMLGFLQGERNTHKNLARLSGRDTRLVVRGVASQQRMLTLSSFCSVGVGLYMIVYSLPPL